MNDKNSNGKMNTDETAEAPTKMIEKKMNDTLDQVNNILACKEL